MPHLLNVIRMGKKSKAAFQREVELVDQVWEGVGRRGEEKRREECGRRGGKSVVHAR